MTTYVYGSGVVSAPIDDRVTFSGSVKHGDRARQIEMSVDIERIVKIAELYKVTKHAGHAVWHLMNPRMPLGPEHCSSCKEAYK